MTDLEQETSTHIRLAADRMIRWWMSIIAGLLLVSLIADAVRLKVGVPGRFATLLRMLDVDQEQSIPTWFSVLNLILTSLLIAAVIHSLRAMNEKHHLIRWMILAAGFLWLSADEAVSIHERLGGVLARKLGSGKMGGGYGFLRFEWVVPAILILAALGVYFLKFLLDQPPRRRWQFIAAGCIYVLGAVVMEMIGGKVSDIKSEHSLTYLMCTHIEEGCEMIGVVWFMRALIEYLAELNPDGLKLSFAARNHPPND